MKLRETKRLFWLSERANKKILAVKHGLRSKFVTWLIMRADKKDLEDFYQLVKDD